MRDFWNNVVGTPSSEEESSGDGTSSAPVSQSDPGGVCTAPPEGSVTIPEVTVVGDPANADPSGGVCQAPPADGGFTPAPGAQSTDPYQGGSSQAPPPSDGGFTPAPGAQSTDPYQGGSSQAPPDDNSNVTPAPGAQSVDPYQGGSSQAPPPADGGFTPAPGAQSVDPNQGGASVEDPCSRARRSPEYDKAHRNEEELAAALQPLKIAYDRAVKMRAAEYAKGVLGDPQKLAEADWQIQQTKAAYNAGYVKYCHAIQDTQKVLADYGCKEAVEIKCKPLD
jgi:hypothetical protein